MLTPGARVGPYEVLTQLGSGGMGEVYRAHDPRLGRDIALKVIRRALVVANGSQDDALERLLREATLASALNHPNIVTIHETGLVDCDRYIAMELVEGQTLRELAADGLPLDRAIHMARQIAEALAVAHGAQIVHRDIKPDNVMVRPDGYVKLLDFGLAKVHHASVAPSVATGVATEPGLIIGTIGYMSPEQARGEVAAPEADIFAFGVMLYELVTGRHPFMAASNLGTLHALMWETPEPPSLVNPDIPRALDQLILETLQKDPRLRPGAGEVLYRLGLADDSTIATAMSSVRVSQRGPRVSRSVVGRDLEMDALLHEYERATHGHGRVVVLSAEAGVGKTTILDAFVKLLEDRGEVVRVGRGRCSERLAGSEAYLPVLEALDSLQHNEQHGGLSRLLRALAPSWYVQIMPAQNDSSAARLAADTALGSQERLKREIATLLDEVTRMHPVVLCFDDMHWADPSTTDLIAYLARRMEEMRLLILVTCRPSDLAQARHPFLPVKLDLVARGVCREIHPGPLDEGAINRYLTLQFAQHSFPRGFASVLQQRTEGHPLFVVDLIRDLRRRQVVRQHDGKWILAEDLTALEQAMPESVRSLVQRKIDALDDGDRRLLGAASVQGIDFDSAVVAAVLDRSQDDVEDALDRLEREHALIRFVDEYEADNRELTLRYRFAHHIYHNAFDGSVRATRRASLSRAIAKQLIARLGTQPCDCAADIALLLESARDHIGAAEYWDRAAQASARLYAHDETARLARRGLALLEREPDSPQKAAVEVGLQMTYGLSIKTSQGYAVPEVGRAYARARELCRRIEDPARVVPVLVGLAAHHVVSGEITTSRDVALEMLDLFNRLGDPNLQMLGQWSLGAALFHLGELEVSHAHLERGLELYNPAFHKPRVWETGIDPGIFCRVEFARTLTLRGYADRGLEEVREAVVEARALEHPQPLAFALLFSTMIHLLRREPAEVCRVYEELADVCRTHGIAQELQWGAPFRGRALVELGETDRGIAELKDGLAAHTLTRSTLMRPYYLVLYAGALLRARRFDEARTALDESRAIAEDTSQHAYDSEHRRLAAEVLLKCGKMDAVEPLYRESIDIAREQGSRWFELRAARGYATFLIDGNRPAEAREVLRICASIPEGRTTMDYVYADALLRTL